MNLQYYNKGSSKSMITKVSGIHLRHSHPRLFLKVETLALLSLSVLLTNEKYELCYRKI